MSIQKEAGEIKCNTNHLLHALVSIHNIHSTHLGNLLHVLQYRRFYNGSRLLKFYIIT